MVAEAFEDAAHDAVAAAMDFDADLLLVGGAGVFDGVGLDVAVFERDALGDLVEVGCREVFIKINVIDFLFEELGVRELGGHVAVVGEQQYARGVAVEAAYGVDALGAAVFHEVHHGLAVLRVFARGNVAFGLVEEHVNLLLNLYRLFVELHHVGAEHLRAEFGNHFAVYRHYACLDVFIGIAARANAGVGKIAVEANRCIGVDVLLFIFKALFLRVLGVGVVAALAAVVVAVVVTALAIIAALLAVVAVIVAAGALTVAALCGTVGAEARALVKVVGCFACVEAVGTISGAVVVVRAIIALSLLAVTALTVVAALLAVAVIVASVLAGAFAVGCAFLVAIIVGARTVASGVLIARTIAALSICAAVAVS